MALSIRLATLLHKIQDVVITDLFRVLPNCLKWYYLFFIHRQIIKCGNSKNRRLYLHGRLELAKAKETTAILFLHGLYGHPYTLLPLAEIAQKAEIGPVFNLHLRYKPKEPKHHRDCLHQSINDIETIIQKNGSKLKGIIAIGHSMGATESAYTALVKKDTRICAVIAIAGRLKETRCPDTAMESTANQIYRGSLEHPLFSLFQIAGREDWNSPLEGTIIRTDTDSHHIIDDAMHLNILYHEETHAKLHEYLKKAVE